MGKPEALPSRAKTQRALPKAPSGIAGLDEITLGGLPRGRPTLVRGSAGCGKTMLDTLETLFGGFTDQALLRAELRRLFRWLKERGLTAVITGERSEGQLTRQGLEEYVSDCVILLDHRVREQVSTRRLRSVKYRGSTHGTNEYPFLIDQSGIHVLPLTSLGLNHAASTERISSGIDGLDAMLGGEGFYRGSSVLISGTAGTGKTSLAAHFAQATCARGERCLYLAFEESPAQLLRNMRSSGVDLAPWVKKGLLRLEASRPTLYGVEMHLATIHKMVNDFQPQVVILDPISNFSSAGTGAEAEAMLLRLIDFLKSRQITAFLTHLNSGGKAPETTDVGVSSIIDSWILLRDIELAGERNRGIYVLKSRGMKNSNQAREFLITSEGIRLEEVYVGPEGVLTGSMRAALEAQIIALRAELEAAEEENKVVFEQDQAAIRHGAEETIAAKGKRK